MSKSRFRQGCILPLVLFRLVIGGILVAALIELHGKLRRTTNRFFDCNGNICLFFHSHEPGYEEGKDSQTDDKYEKK